MCGWFSAASVFASRSNRAKRSGWRRDQRDDLQGDVTSEPDVVRTIHLTPPAGAEWPDDDVVADAIAFCKAHVLRELAPGQPVAP
jgi:hypothetical protein